MLICVLIYFDMARLVHISDFLGLRRSTVGMLSMVILVGMGEKMAERFLPIYLMALGGGAFLWLIGPAFNFLVAFSCGLLGTIGFALWGEDLK